MSYYSIYLSRVLTSYVRYSSCTQYGVYRIKFTEYRTIPLPSLPYLVPSNTYYTYRIEFTVYELLHSIKR